MRKNIAAAIITAALTIVMSATAFAGSWEQDREGWRYRNDSGAYAAGGWQWTDGNGDGTAECYYFNENGLMLAGTVTPDGYVVNADGAWTVNGAVQSLTVAADYDRNPARFNSLDGVGLYGSNITDCGSYYSVEYNAGNLEGGDEESFGRGIVRVRKSAVVHWDGYLDADRWGEADLSLTEYAAARRMGWAEEDITLSNMRMINVVQDAEGYIVAFSDGSFN